ncbi:ATP-binding protein [Streptomyces luteireticuli]|uniref:ATP-binding protein n=1 Tax=Streptomyces luteireticuli TaxID=173858 RepID=UPI003557536D
MKTDRDARLGVLRLPGTLTSLQAVARFALDLAALAGLPDEAAYRLRLAADELATNVVVHGYRGREGELRLEGGVDPDTVWLRLEDDAPRFDPRDGHRPPQTDLPLEQRPIGGLGVHLALTALDDFSHGYADGRNSSTLVIRRDGPGHRPSLK